VTSQTETIIRVKYRRGNDLKHLQTSRVLNQKPTSFNYAHSEVTKMEEGGCSPHGNISSCHPDHNGANSDEEVRKGQWILIID